MVYESTTTSKFDRVVYNFRPWSGLSSYKPRRFNNVCPDVPPNTPTGLTATAVSSTQINLSWNDPGGDKDSYNVYFANDAYVTTTTNTTFEVTGLSPCTDFSFYVKASKDGLESGPSNTASARTGLPPGTGGINGRIMDSADNPIAGVNVSVSSGGAQGATDDAGMYALCGVPPGPAQVAASRDAYSSGSANVTVTAGAFVVAPDIVLAAYCPVGQYRAEYFNNRTLTGNAPYVRCETSIAYDWGTSGGPGHGIGNDNFSVRWVGRFSFSARNYSFVARSDDGLRIWVDGASILSRWFDQGPGAHTVLHSLSAGEHVIQVDYYEHLGAAVAQVQWQ